MLKTEIKDIWKDPNEKCNIWNENVLHGINRRWDSTEEKNGESEGRVIETIN